VYHPELHARHAERQLEAFLERRRLERLARNHAPHHRRNALRLALGRALVGLGRRVGGEGVGSPAFTG
jgi:hypothetical protein